jgi:hypothetical protein
MSQDESQEPRAIESDGGTRLAVSEHDDTGANGDGGDQGNAVQRDAQGRLLHGYPGSLQVAARAARPRSSSTAVLDRVARSRPELLRDAWLVTLEVAGDRSSPRHVDALRLATEYLDGKAKATIEHQGNQAQIGVMVVGPGGRPIELGEVASPRSMVGMSLPGRGSGASSVALPVASVPPASPVASSPVENEPPPNLAPRLSTSGSPAGPTDTLATRVAALEAGQARMLELLEKLVASRA